MSHCILSTWILRDVPLDEALSLLGGSGFGMVELSGSGSALLTAWEKDPAAFMREMEAIGVGVPSFHCLGEGRRALDSPDEAARMACIEVNRRCFERMRDCGIAEMVLHPGGEDGAAHGDPAQRRATARDSLQRLADMAGDMGLRIAAENAQKTLGPGATMATLQELLDGLGGHVGLCHDVGHSALAGLDPVAEVRTALATGKLFSLHLHDVTEGGVDHVMPGEGALALDALLGELDKAGFGGYRTLELKPFEGDIAARLAQAAAVRDAWDARDARSGRTV